MPPSRRFVVRRYDFEHAFQAVIAGHEPIARRKAAKALGRTAARAWPRCPAFRRPVQWLRSRAGALARRAAQPFLPADRLRRPLKSNVRPHMVPSASFRPLDPEIDWAFFDPEFRLPQNLRVQIQPLTDAASQEFWSKHVSANPIERHPMLLPPTHWLKPSQEGPNWVPEFNSEKKKVGVGTILRRVFALDFHESVYFIAMREQIYSVPFGIFLDFWPCFLAGDDEGAFLFHARSGAFARFGPNGALSFGSRGANAA